MQTNHKTIAKCAKLRIDPIHTYHSNHTNEESYLFVCFLHALCSHFTMHNLAYVYQAHSRFNERHKVILIRSFFSFAFLWTFIPWCLLLFLIVVEWLRQLWPIVRTLHQNEMNIGLVAVHSAARKHNTYMFTNGFLTFLPIYSYKIYLSRSNESGMNVREKWRKKKPLTHRAGCAEM